MFPIRDSERSYSTPFVTILLIVMNLLIFLYEISLEPYSQNHFTAQWALVPARFHAIDLLTSMFLHGGWMHVLGNMWFLWIFGDNVEDRFGTPGFLALYFLGGLAAAGLEIFTDPHSRVYSLGASGAIAAVLGGYLVLFPKARVITFIPIFLFPWIISIPAVVWLGIWFLYQWLNGMAVLHQHAAGGVAYWAHVGGFLFGVLVALPARLREKTPGPGRRPIYGYDQEWPFA